MNLQEQISRMQEMMGVINETKFFRRRVQPVEVARYFMLFAEQVFFETDNYEQFRYELVLRSLEHIMWQEYEMSWEELPEQEEIDYVNNVAEMYDEVIRPIYDKYYNR
jgi:isoaspartyl peptidase/L-asparaginase-like protein (Ntn-hydrolase superfamily)